MMLLSAFGFLAAEATSVALRFREAADMVFFISGYLGDHEDRSGWGGDKLASSGAGICD